MQTPFMRYVGGRAKALTFSYDDGISQDLRLAELLRQNGLKGTFNLNSGLFGVRLNEYQLHLTAEETAELYVPKGHEVAVHTVNHLFLEKLSKERVLYEIMEDRRRLEEMSHTVVRGMAYPWGTYSEAVLQAAEMAGIVYSRTILSTGDFRIPESWLCWHPTCHHSDSRLMELANRFVNETPESQPYDRTPWLFYVWGHGYEFDLSQNWSLIEELTALLAGRSDIWYVTNGEIHDYVEAYRHLNWTLQGDAVYNPTAVPVWFELERKIYVVQPGELLTLPTR